MLTLAAASANVPAVRRHALATAAFVALLCLGAGGCRRHIGATVPSSADARWQRRLEGLARRDLGCRAVRLVALNEAVWQVDGCGHLLEYELLCAGRHCSWHRIEPAALRAARDFACPISSLAASVPAATRRDFSGCGRAASYTLHCGASHCEWQTYAAPGAGYAVSAAAPPGYGTGAAPAGTTGEGSLDDVVIPPPPGAAPAAPPTTAPSTEPPQPITAVPDAPTDAPSDGATTDGSSTDDAVIPPPPS